MLIDTHCHINIMIKKDFDVPLPQNFKELTTPLIEDCKHAGVTKIINVGTSVSESINCITLAQNYSTLWATIGLHPNDADENWKKDIESFKKLLQNPQNKIVGIGEIGLDYHYPDHNKIFQQTVFEAQIQLALDHDLPIVIHTRDAGQDVLNILETYKSEKLRGVIHCFSEDLAFAERAIALNFVLGIGGPLTYPKNNELRKVFTTVPLDTIVLETDAPFLPPQEMRGKKNNPANIKIIAHYLAKIRNISFETVAHTTTDTAEKLFKI
ncbi:TatD family hydrolase [Candidatus Babeliales bacterium]|nr:TatD family hydrolase [Candidatus Babeliales bacterium]